MTEIFVIAEGISRFHQILIQTTKTLAVTNFVTFCRVNFLVLRGNTRIIGTDIP